jgi:hypothetical protein
MAGSSFAALAPRAASASSLALPSADSGVIDRLSPKRRRPLAL